MQEEAFFKFLFLLQKMQFSSAVQQMQHLLKSSKLQEISKPLLVRKFLKKELNH